MFSKKSIRVSFFLFVLFFTGEFFLSAQVWKPLGPDTIPELLSEKDNSSKFARGIGRVANLRILPGKKRHSEEPVLFLGTPYGGLWKLSPGDKKWHAENTHQLMHIGVADLAINPGNTAIRYIATGDPDCIIDPNGPALSSEFCQSRGIVKSSDAGKTWTDHPIGMWYNSKNELEIDFWKYPSRKIARRLLIDPKCPDRITVVIHTYTSSTKSYDGFIYQSEDGGETWNQRLIAPDGFLKDLEYKPGSRKIMYTSGRSLYKSRDKGLTWKKMYENGLPHDSLVKRIELACSPSAKSIIYALVIYKNLRNSDIFISHDDAESFEKIVSALESPEWRTAIAVDSDNPKLVYFTAGNRVHRLYPTENGWRQVYTGGFTHDDVHELTYVSQSKKLYASTDGGIYVSQDSGKSWNDISAGLNVAECWSVAVTQSGALSVASGLQDCGTIVLNQSTDIASSWKVVRGGDGMAAAFDYENEYVLYANDGSNNILARSIDGGSSWSRNLLPRGGEKAVYQRPFLVDPARQGVIYTGLKNVFKSVDYGDSWIKFSDFNYLPETEKLVALALVPEDTNSFYAAFSNPTWNKDQYKKLYKTIDAGKTWQDISKGLTGVSWTNITSIIVDPGNSNIVYVGFRGGWDYKIMVTRDAGANWENYSEGLDFDSEVNALIADKDSQNTIYAATHNGVYKRNKTDKEWKRFGTQLPRVIASALDIRFEDRTLFVGTHGLGVWYIKLSE